MSEESTSTAPNEPGCICAGGPRADVKDPECRVHGVQRRHEDGVAVDVSRRKKRASAPWPPAQTLATTPNEVLAAAAIAKVAQDVSVLAIGPSPTNPRRTYDKEAMAELTASVAKHGVLQPVLLRPWPPGQKVVKTSWPFTPHAPTHQLVAGERRLRAAAAAGLETVPALVRELTDEEVIEIQVVENLQRQDLHPLEEAEGYRQLLAAKGNVTYDVAKIAERVGRSVAYVRDRVKLLSLTKQAQDLFRDGRIQAGHAVILARLSPKDQARAIGTEQKAFIDGGLFTHEALLWDPSEDDHRFSRLGQHYKAKTARELQAWVDGHVRFTPENPDLPDLFPETFTALHGAEEEAEKVIPITFDHYVRPEVKDGTRTWGPQSWRRADKRTCEHAITGFVAVGPARGEAFKVCTARKECKTHWGPEIRQARKRASSTAATGKTGEDRWAREQRKQEEERKREEALRARWGKALPAILEAVAAAVEKARGNNVARGALGDLVVERCRNRRGWSFQGGGGRAGLVGRGTSDQQLIRHAAFLVLEDAARDWTAPRDFRKVAGRLGVDVAKILEAEAPEPKPEPAPATEKKAKRGRK